MKEDFEEREYMEVSGWPIGYEDLKPYYKKAEEILGTDATVPFSYQPWREFHIDEPSFSSSTINLFVTKWCKVPNFSVQHGSKLRESKAITMLSNANVVELIPAGAIDAVESLRIRSLDGKEGFVNAKYVIAAGGAMETVRLFLASDKFYPGGLGNKNGLVGRYFQDHCAAVVGRIYPHDRQQFHDVFDPFYKNGFKYLPRIRLNPSAARIQKILHASAQIVFSKRETGILENAKNILNAIKKKRLPSVSDVKLLLNPSKFSTILKAAYRWRIQHRGSSNKGPIWLEIHSEQEPSFASCIKLGDSKDALGMPRICLDWNISDLTIETIKKTAKLVQKEFNNSKIGKVVLEPWVLEEERRSLRWVRDVYHQSGGLKMGDNEQSGVVDRDCKVFGVKNLYVASSAVFPTSSFSNPTMTTIALAIRICETVKANFRGIREVN